MKNDAADKIQPDEQMQTNVAETMQQISHRMFNPKLAALRAQNPFLQIMPLPNVSIAGVLSANAAVDINLPTGTKMIFISGSNEYYISRNGKAEIPTASLISGLIATSHATGALQNPEGVFLYVEEIKQLSIVAVNDNTRITIGCYSQV